MFELNVRMCVCVCVCVMWSFWKLQNSTPYAGKELPLSLTVLFSFCFVLLLLCCYLAMTIHFIPLHCCYCCRSELKYVSPTLPLPPPLLSLSFSLCFHLTQSFQRSTQKCGSDLLTANNLDLLYCHFFIWFPHFEAQAKTPILTVDNKNRTFAPPNIHAHRTTQTYRKRKYCIAYTYVSHTP